MSAYQCLLHFKPPQVIPSRLSFTHSDEKWKRKSVETGVVALFMTQTLLGNINLFTMSWIKDSSIELNNWKNKERKTEPCLCGRQTLNFTFKSMRAGTDTLDLVLFDYSVEESKAAPLAVLWQKSKRSCCVFICKVSEVPFATQSFTTQNPVKSRADLITRPSDKSISNYKR